MEDIMQSNTFFIVPLTIAYGTICALWFLLNRNKQSWPITPILNPPKPWLELGVALVAVIGVLFMGQLYAAGYLLKDLNNEPFGLLVWPSNNVLIFSPIFIALLVRKQGLQTIFISKHAIFWKLIFGTISSCIGILLFLLLRGEIGRVSEIAYHAVSSKALANFPAIFFENVALAFLFVRLKWAIGIRWAIGIPSALFAFAHVPGSLAEGDPLHHIITFFFLTGGLTTFILYTAYRSRDIIWLGVVHYLMDVTIKAF